MKQPIDVPFVNLGCQLGQFRGRVLELWGQILEQGAFIGGEIVSRYEEAFADFCGAKHGVGVASGTDALLLALKALGVGKGHQVITAANTFVATAEAIAHSGAKPILVDVDPKTYNIDVKQVEAHLTRQTKAIIPVHLYGHPADMAPILEVAGHHGIDVIEDASQAHGAEYRGRPVGTWGHLGCFSFYPSKNLGACGDAGAVVTDNERLALRLRQLRNHGAKSKYAHELIGFNSRLDSIQAAALLVKLDSLREWNQQRRSCAALYDDLLSGVSGVTTPMASGQVLHVYHLYVIRTPAHLRDSLRRHLGRQGVQTGVHYPQPVHRTRAFSKLRWTKCPMAERLAGEIISLPMYPGLREDQIRWVAHVISDFMDHRLSKYA
ncbi:MAG: DegT/DnrJ/EryC1/StrS family aminotransferase [Acidobacteriota bacterium]